MLRESLATPALQVLQEREVSRAIRVLRESLATPALLGHSALQATLAQ